MQRTWAGARAEGRSVSQGPQGEGCCLGGRLSGSVQPSAGQWGGLGVCGRAPELWVLSRPPGLAFCLRMEGRPAVVWLEPRVSTCLPVSTRGTSSLLQVPWPPLGPLASCGSPESQASNPRSPASCLGASLGNIWRRPRRSFASGVFSSRTRSCLPVAPGFSNTRLSCRSQKWL